MPATTNARTTDGPARSAIAAAVRTKRPAPMIAPMPSATSAIGPRVRLSVPSPVCADSAIRRSIDLVLNSEPATYPPLIEACGTRRLYISEGEKHPDALARIAGEQVRDHGDRRRARREHFGRALERDSTDRDDGTRTRARRGVAEEIEAPC